MNSLVLILACSVMPLAAAESLPPANRLAADLLIEAGRRQPEAKPFLDRLSAGLADGSISLAEAGQVLLIAEKARMLGGGSDGAPRPLTSALPPPRLVEGDRRKAEDLLANLDGVPPAARVTPPAAPATTSPPVATPPAAPAAVVVKGSVGGVRTVEKDGVSNTYAVIDKGRAAGLARDQRLVVVRDGKPVVHLVVIKVEDDASVTMVLDATWVAGARRSLAKGEVVETEP